MNGLKQDFYRVRAARVLAKRLGHEHNGKLRARAVKALMKLVQRELARQTAAGHFRESDVLHGGERERLVGRLADAVLEGLAAADTATIEQGQALLVNARRIAEMTEPEWRAIIAFEVWKFADQPA